MGFSVSLFCYCCWGYTLCLSVSVFTVREYLELATYVYVVVI